MDTDESWVAADHEAPPSVERWKSIQSVVVKVVYET